MTANPPPATIGAALRQASQRWGQRTAYRCGPQAHTFAGMEASSARLACGLLGLGIARGERIGVIGLNQIEWLQLFFAASRIGVAVVGLSVRYRDNEIEHMVNDSAVKAVFTVPECEGFDFPGMLARLAPRMPGLSHVVLIDPINAIDAIETAPPADTSSLRLSMLLATAPDPAVLEAAEAQVVPQDQAMVIYTSGTTGRPKGAGLSHRSMLAAALAQARHVRTTEADQLQLALPLNHVGGITCGVLNFLLGGGTCDLVPAFKANLVLARMREHPPTIFSGVPTMATLLLMHPDSAKVDFSSVRLVIVGGATVDAALLEQLQARMPQATVMNLYGLSESSGAIVMTPWDAQRQDLMQSIGRVFDTAEVRVVSFAGESLATGEIGELCFRGAGVCPGYVGGAAGEDGFDAQGWLHSGDLGYVDERGYIHLKGRKKDMYIQGGFNVYPAEIEGVIARHPAVMMVAGIGVPDPVLGEIGRYYIVPKPGCQVSEQEIRAYCGTRLADYKVPRQVVLRDALPLTPAGKIHKAALRTEDAPDTPARPA
ncbi:class I adenylate-forming enzyme family protein [Cupriavidus basilensis]|uniref:AMP-binding protein n=1 Tax=Cupriavidus basilensis TaxID=68895 RepID=A0A643G2T1_9BURK|nr:AMP-binding protein [Cupriavidus basilensis]QOT81210.1 AMP-binding protein [Cupriavidus basilensis]